jgi:hypothetical protein
MCDVHGGGAWDVCHKAEAEIGEAPKLSIPAQVKRQFLFRTLLLFPSLFLSIFPSPEGEEEEQENEEEEEEEEERKGV